MIEFIELFAGIGGFRYGLEEVNRNIKYNKNRRQKKSDEKTFVGFDCIWANEWDKYACKIYRKNFGKEELIEADIRTIDTGKIPDHDLLTAGFPCQAFSIAGKRKGFDDTRGTLFFEIGRVLQYKKPGYFILENVKGLLSHDNGQTFETIITSLNELGYDLQWQMLNSKDFGVPQNRERVFIIGHLRGTSRPEIFPIRNSNKENDTMEKQYIAKTIKAGDYKLPGDLQLINYSINIIAHRKNYRRNTQVFNPNGITEALDTGQGGGRGQHTIQNMKIRRLTPIECERLQGFPDNWTEGVSDTQRYKMLGNAVTTNVITEIGKRLLND